MKKICTYILLILILLITIAARPIETIKSLDAFVLECEHPGILSISCLYIDNTVALHLSMGTAKSIPLSPGKALIWDEPWKESSVIAVLMHDYLEGYKLYGLDSGTIYLIWSNGTIDKYTITEASKWENDYNLQLFTPWDGGTQVSATYLLNRYYLLPTRTSGRQDSHYNRLVIQTCIDGSVGVQFIVAVRVNQEDCQSRPAVWIAGHTAMKTIRQC